MPHPVDGPPTELLVLGSAHLNAETTDAALQATLERLLAWRPQAVAVEVLPGDVIQSYRLEGELYADLRWVVFLRRCGSKRRRENTGPGGGPKPRRWHCTRPHPHPNGCWPGWWRWNR